MASVNSTKPAAGCRSAGVLFTPDNGGEDSPWWNSIGETVDAVAPRVLIEDHPALRHADLSTVAFLGWEWSQVGATPETHFGHKNVILRGLDDAQIPTRPIAAPRPEFAGMLPASARLLLPLAYFQQRQQYLDYFV